MAVVPAYVQEASQPPIPGFPSYPSINTNVPQMVHYGQHLDVESAIRAIKRPTPYQEDQTCLMTA
jgi:hypothetical protein